MDVSDAEHQEVETHGAFDGSMCHELLSDGMYPGTPTHKLIPLSGRARMEAQMAIYYRIEGLSIFGVWRVGPLWKVPRWIGVTV